MFRTKWVIRGPMHSNIYAPKNPYLDSDWFKEKIAHFKKSWPFFDAVFQKGPNFRTKVDPLNDFFQTASFISF